MWIVEVADRLVFHGALDVFGIRPRLVSGLPGIVFAPFLHGGFGHLLANTLPFLILGWLVMIRRTADFFVVSGVVMLLAGFGVWLFGAPNSVHLGASSLIFGYLGFLLLRGFFERSFTSIVVAILVAAIYGGAIFGVLPIQRGISWQGHLFGFAGGILAARLLTSPARRSGARRLDRAPDF